MRNSITQFTLIISSSIAISLMGCATNSESPSGTEHEQAWAPKRPQSGGLSLTHAKLGTCRRFGGVFCNAPASRCLAHLFVIIAGRVCDQLCVGWIFILSQSDERSER
jgi:hypothetical protein